MTVAALPNYQTYTGNGSAGPFPFSFMFYYNSELLVRITDLLGNVTTLTLNADYTVTGAGTDTGGSVSLIMYSIPLMMIVPRPLPAGYNLTVTRILPMEQDVSMPVGGPFSPPVVEGALDYLTMICQQLYSYILAGTPGPQGPQGPGGLDSTAIHKATSAEISGLTDKATPVDADVVLGEDSASSFAKIKITWAHIKSVLKTYFDGFYGPLRWVQTTGTFTATPASTSTLTMTSDLTATLIVGTPLKYKIAGTYYYGIVTAITSNLLTLAGAPMGGNVTELWYGDQSRVIELVVVIPSTYESASSTTLIVSKLNSKLYWKKAISYLVAYSVYSNVVDTGTKGKATVLIATADVNSSAGGLTLTAAQTEYKTVVDINTTNYVLNYGSVIEIGCTKSGNGDATDLTVHMIAVIA